MARTFRINRPDPSPEDCPADWLPSIPPCGRCGALHWREGLTRLDDGSWAGDSCLTPEEQRAWMTIEEKPVGKVHIPVH